MCKYNKVHLKAKVLQSALSKSQHPVCEIKFLQL